MRKRTSRGIVLALVLLLALLPTSAVVAQTTIVLVNPPSQSVQVGQWVTSGQSIGRVGQSGRATGPHLHFEIRQHGLPLNPQLLLAPRP